MLENYVRTVLDAIASSKVTVEHSKEFDLYIARTGIYINPEKGGKKIFIGGFSCQKDKEQALRVSKYEVAERLLATYEMSHQVMRENGYRGYFINGELSKDLVDPKEVLLYLGEKTTHGNDAVGLSFHTILKAGIFHAVGEFLERWLLARIWYENANLILIGRKNLGKKYIVEHYTVLSKSFIPFVMTILFDANISFLTMGASLAPTFKIAQSKSLAEACMLGYDIVSKKNYELISNKESIIRMQSQSDKDLSRSRYTFIKSIATTKQINIDVNKRFDSLETIIKKLELPSDCVKYCLLHQTPEYVVIRAYSHKLLSLRRYRELFYNSEYYFLDPVC